MKKLILIFIAFAFLFGTEFHTSKKFHDKITGAYLSERNISLHQYNTLSEPTSNLDETDNLDILLAESPVKYFVKITIGKVKVFPSVILTPALKHPFIFDLPPPNIYC